MITNMNEADSNFFNEYRRDRELGSDGVTTTCKTFFFLLTKQLFN